MREEDDEGLRGYKTQRKYEDNMEKGVRSGEVESYRSDHWMVRRVTEEYKVVYTGRQQDTMAATAWEGWKDEAYSCVRRHWMEPWKQEHTFTSEQVG